MTTPKPVDDLVRRLVGAVGGPARAKVIAAFASVLALEGADLGAVGAMAGPLQHALGITKTELGLLLSASLGIGALATIPFGALVDRVNRVRLLTWIVITWGIAMILCGTATSYMYLLIVRILLGGITACAAPALASLIGDSFFPEERGRIYGYVLSGEFLGTGIGILLAGELAGWSWRAGFIALGPPALLVAWALHRIPEPARGGADRLPWGSTSFEDAKVAGGGSVAGPQPDTMQRLIEARGIAPRRRLVLDDTQARSAWWGIKYVLRIPTNLILILASALGGFYFAGVRTFGIEYLRLRHGVSHGMSVVLVIAIGAGALAGVLISGQLADRLLRRGHLRARPGVAGGAFLVAVMLLAGGLFAGPLWLAMVLFVLAAASLGAMDPPLDGARLDIIPPALWGRAEAARTVLRKSCEALAPLAFGAVAQYIFGTGIESAGGLHLTFLVMLIALGAAGATALAALWTYPRDVAAAQANQDAPAGRRSS